MKPSTEMDYHRRIGRVLAAILDDPAAPHTVDSLAAVAGLSPFHFHRVWRALTGEGTAETVQRLRLAQAARRLSRSAEPVIAVALDAGYESPQAFARAFRSFTGVSPGGFRARQRDIARADVVAEGEPRVVIRRLPPMALLGLEHHGPPATIRQTYRRLRRLAPPAASSTTVGVGYGDPEQPQGFRYLAAVTRPAAGGGDGLISMDLPGGLYAVHRLIGPHALIAPTFQALFGGWLPRSGRQPDNGPTVEIYRDDRGAAGEPVTDLMIPIREESPP